MSWNVEVARACEQPSTGLLLAGGLARMVLGRLTAEERAPFDSLHQSLREWFPSRHPKELNDIYETWWPPTMSVSLAYNDRKHPSGHAMTCAYLQMYCVKSLVPRRTLPGDGFHDMGVEHFAAAGRDVGRVSKTSMSALGRRAAALSNEAGAPFDEQCALSDRMLWDVAVRESDVTKRLQPALLHLSSGGAWEWVEVGGARMLRLPGAGATFTLRLDDAERAALASYVPALAE